MDNTSTFLKESFILNSVGALSVEEKLINWDDFDRKVNNLSLGHIVYYNHKDQDYLSDFLKNKYKVLFEKNKAFNIVQYNELKKILTCLHEENVSVIVFKGAYLLEKYYKQLGLRLMGDIDLLIHKVDLPKVKNILKKLKFKYKKESCPKNWYDKNYYRSSLYIKGSVEVEIHWDFFPPVNPLKFNINDVWHGATPGELCGTLVMEMSPELLFIYLCVHLSYSHFFNHNSLRRLYDIFIMLDNVNLDFKKIVEKSFEYEVENFVGITLSYLKEIFDANIDKEMISTLISDKKVKIFKKIVPVASFFTNKKEKNPYKIMVRQRLIQSIGAKSSLKYWEMVLTNKRSTAKWIANLYGISPYSIKVLLYNWLLLPLTTLKLFYHKVKLI